MIYIYDELTPEIARNSLIDVEREYLERKGRSNKPSGLKTLELLTDYLVEISSISQTSNIPKPNKTNNSNNPFLKELYNPTRKRNTQTQRPLKPLRTFEYINLTECSEKLLEVAFNLIEESGKEVKILLFHTDFLDVTDRDYTYKGKRYTDTEELIDSMEELDYE